MASPLAPRSLGKRPLDHALSAEPTARKEARTETVFTRLEAVVMEIKAEDPSSITEAQREVLVNAEKMLQSAIDRIDEQLEAVRNPPPEETPIPFDDLVNVLSLLHPKDLAQAAQVSRHFARAMPAAVRNKLDKLASGFFETRHGDTLNAEFMHRIETDFESASTLIKNLDVEKDDEEQEARKKFRIFEDAIECVHDEVLYLHKDEIAEKLYRLQENSTNAESVPFALNEERRGLLMKLLHRAKMPEDELPDYMDVIAHEVERASSCFWALYEMRRLPAACIEEHIDVILKCIQGYVSKLKESPGHIYDLKNAVEVLGCLPQQSRKSLSEKLTPALHEIIGAFNESDSLSLSERRRAKALHKTTLKMLQDLE